MAKTAPKRKNTLSAKWQQLNSKRSSLLSRCEDYAQVSLPYVFPRNSTGDREMQSALDSTGARAVNFLTNKLVMTLFPESQPFFRLQVSDDVINQMTQAAKAGDEQAAQMIASIDGELAAKERQAVQSLGYTKFRTEATSAMRLLIITGNACMYHPINDSANPQVYNLRDYCVERDLSGNLIRLITQDKKAFSTFSKEIQDKLNAGSEKKRAGDDLVTLYTMVELHTDQKYHLSQSIEDVQLDSEGVWVKDELPWKVLTWNLLRGEDYGHGLVEDNYGALHALAVLSEAGVSGAAVAAEIKFLVNPASMLDVKALNESESGSYHSGMKDDVTCVQLDKAIDFQFVTNLIDRLERQIAAVFLMNSAVQRDAERVTAEEIRYVAQELEMAHAGVYSRMATEWQYPTAIMLLAKIGAKIGKDSKIQPMIITGIDALSRAGEMDNFRALVYDLASLNTVPPEILKGFDSLKLIEYLALRRGVDYMKFSKTPGQMAQEQQAEFQNEQALQQQQLQGQAEVAQVKAQARR